MTPASAGPLARFASGVRADVVQHALLIASQMLMVPLFLSRLGDIEYGAWLLLTSLASFAALADLGSQTYAINCATVCRLANDRAELRRVVHSALLLSSLGALVVLQVGLLWLFSSHGRALVRSLGGDEFSTLLAATELFAAATLAIPGGLIAGLYRVGSEYARGVYAASAQRLAQVTLSCAALVMGADLAAIATVHLACTAVSVIAMTIDLKLRHRWLPLGFLDADLRLCGSMIGNGMLFLLITLAMLLGQQGSLQLVHAAAGAAAVAAFATLRTLANLARQVFGALVNALWPETTLLHAQNAWSTLQRVHRLGSKLTLGVAVAVTAPLLACGEEVHQYWTRGRLPYDEGLFAILILHLLSQAYWATSATLLNSSNRQRAVATSLLRANTLALIIGWALLPWFGGRGVAAALAAFDLLVCGVRIPRITARWLRMSALDLPRTVLLRGLPTLTSGFAVAMVTAHAAPGPGLPRWILTGAATGLTILVLGVVSWLDVAERRTLKRLARALVRRHRPVPVKMGGTP